MLLDSFTYRAEDDALFTQFLLEGGFYAYRVHDGIDSGIATQCQSLLEGNTQFIEGLFKLWVYPSAGTAGHRTNCRVGVIRDGLIVNLRHKHMSPCRLRLFLPITESLQTELEHPIGFPFLC